MRRGRGPVRHHAEPRACSPSPGVARTPAHDAAVFAYPLTDLEPPVGPSRRHPRGDAIECGDPIPASTATAVTTATLTRPSCSLRARTPASCARATGRVTRTGGRRPLLQRVAAGRQVIERSTPWRRPYRHNSTVVPASAAEPQPASRLTSSSAPRLGIGCSGPVVLSGRRDEHRGERGSLRLGNQTDVIWCRRRSSSSCRALWP